MKVGVRHRRIDGYDGARACGTFVQGGGIHRFHISSWSIFTVAGKSGAGKSGAGKSGAGKSGGRTRFFVMAGRCAGHL
jgi:hypothetical protein